MLIAVEWTENVLQTVGQLLFIGSAQTYSYQNGIMADAL